MGNFGFGPDPKGLSIYRYDPATAMMGSIESVFDEVNVGYMALDDERNSLCLANECQNPRGQKGSNYLMALRVDPQTGKTMLISENPTRSDGPCCICLTTAAVNFGYAAFY